MKICPNTRLDFFFPANTSEKRSVVLQYICRLNKKKNSNIEGAKKNFVCKNEPAGSHWPTTFTCDEEERVRVFNK